jgi:hypothetical protein
MTVVDVLALVVVEAERRPAGSRVKVVLTPSWMMDAAASVS